jgi:hypothetical protein
MVNKNILLKLSHYNDRTMLTLFGNYGILQAAQRDAKKIQGLLIL